MAGILDLPNELILHISTYQSPPDINSLMRTCRHFAGPLAYGLLDNVCRARSSEYGKRALYSAVICGNDTIIKWLLGRKVFEFAANGEILHDAVANQSVRVVAALLEYGVGADNKGFQMRTPLAIAAAAGRTDVVRLFLARDDVDFNALDCEGETPFFKAAACGREEVVRVMLADGRFEVNHAGRFTHRTPLMAAVSRTHVGVVGALLDDERVDVNARGTDSWTPLHLAVQSGKEEIVRMLLDNCKVDVTLWVRNQRAIHMATKMGHEGMVRLFLRDSRVEAIMGDRRLNIHGDTPLYLAVLHGREEIVKLLLEDERVDVGRKNGMSWGPLHIAATGVEPAIVQLLLAHDKIDVNAGDMDEESPLHIAVKSQRQSGEHQRPHTAPPCGKGRACIDCRGALPLRQSSWV
ncbi:ankyrin repeat-containing domain protein [Tuber brumale]|nr:ankyrin repeat-containing domain protein [Tuber brumale]